MGRQSRQIVNKPGFIRAGVKGSRGTGKCMKLDLGLGTKVGRAGPGRAAPGEILNFRPWRPLEVTSRCGRKIDATVMMFIMVMTLKLELVTLTFLHMFLSVCRCV